MKRLFTRLKEKTLVMIRSLRGRFSLTFAALFLTMLVILIFMISRLSSLYNQAVEIQNAAVETERLITDMDELYGLLTDFALIDLEGKDVEYREKMDAYLRFFEQKQAAGEGEYTHYYRDLYAMAVYFDESANNIIADHNAGVTTSILRSRMAALKNTRGFISAKLLELMKLQIEAGQQTMYAVQTSLSSVKAITIVTAAAAAIGIVFLADFFTKRFLRTLNELADHTARIQSGDFAPFVPRTAPSAEIDSLITSYNQMSSSIQTLLETTAENARLEGQLKEKTIANLELNNMLQETELKFLRSQINPHFLFNTLNATISVAELENAAAVKDILLHITYILRHAIRDTSRFVPLKDEIDLVQHYLQIQRIRFGARLQLESYVDPSVYSEPVPSMILQPFIENAILHGIEPMEEGGVVGFFVLNHGDYVLVHIRDNGAGMSDERLQQLRGGRREEGASQHGIDNVLERLRIIYKQDVVDIHSTLGGGTSIRLMLPRMGTEADVVG